MLAAVAVTTSPIVAAERPLTSTFETGRLDATKTVYCTASKIELMEGLANNVPKDLKYSKEHEWVRQSDAVVVVGLTDYAQRQLGDIVFVELPKVGQRFEADRPFGTVESVKSVSELFAPVTGQVIEVNEELNVDPEIINTDPYGDGWLLKIRMADANQATGLLTAAEYTAYVQE